MYAAISQHQTVNIRQISQNWAEQIGYYRFLENEKVTRSELVRSISDHCEQQVEGRHILALSDTSEINLQSHAGRLKAEGLGVVGNNRDVGFFIHPTLVLDAESGFPLGLSNVQIWTRALERPNKTERKYKTLPIEKKESYKWLAAAERSQRCFEVGGAKLVTHLGDREADIYEEWATVPDQSNHVLVRVRTDRCLLESTETLYSQLNKQPCAGTYSMLVTADHRIGRTERIALMSVRFTIVQIQRLTVLALSVAVRTLQMVEGRDNVELPATITFSADQQECLTQIEPTLEGRTSKQQNPYPKTSLPWAIWIVARLGGWSGYRSQTPPGMPTLVNGLRRFQSVFEGWNLGQIRLVYTR